MPQILITADAPDKDHDAVFLRERISLPDLESDHFAAQLVERMGWALVDADDVEHASHKQADHTSASATGPRRR